MRDDEQPRAPTPLDDHAARVDGVMPPPTQGFAARYVDLAPLGRGGMGELRLLRDNVIGRDVAMKVLREDLDAPGPSLARMLREARVQGQLEHPAIVPVYDLGVDPAGRAYFTMKRVRGSSLAEIIARPSAAWPRRRLLGAFATVCLALHYAHTRGVLHRDVKPSNVMLGDFGEVYLLDWGVARVRGIPEPDAPPMTRVDDGSVETVVGATLGTPGYMSVEALRGETDLDARSDVYSLGAVLFEILAGEALHPQRTINGRVLSTLDPGSLRPSDRRPDADISPELDAICERALATDRAARLASARELAEAVERYLDGDRDTERRRAVAATHATLARDALQRALRGDGDEAESRAAAMREATRAMSLDADNRDALDTFVRLVASPPRVVPAAVEEEIARSQRAMQRVSATWGVMGFASFFGLIPLLLWSGVRSPWTLAAMYASVALAAAAHLIAARNPARDTRMPWSVLVATHGAVALSSLLTGPLWFTPMLAVTNLIGLVFTYDRARRGYAIAAACAGVLAPLLMELAGIVPPSYAFEHGRVTLSSHALHLRAAPALLAMSMTAVGGVLIAGVITARFRDLLTAADRAVQLSAWQLRQAVPTRADDP